MNEYKIERLTAIRGFTFIELMVAIAVLAILLTLATPSVQKIIRDSRVTSQTNEVIALVNLTRNEAIRRGIDNNDADEAILRLDGTNSSWSGNVSVTGGDTAPDCPSGVIRCSENSNVGLTTTSTDLSFESRGYLRTFTEETITLEHSPCEGDRQRVEITILPTGQITTETGPCSD